MNAIHRAYVGLWSGVHKVTRLVASGGGELGSTARDVVIVAIVVLAAWELLRGVEEEVDRAGSDLTIIVGGVT